MDTSKRLIFDQIPAAFYADALSAFPDTYGYPAQVQGTGDQAGQMVPNPQSVEEFTIEKIMEYMVAVVAPWKVKQITAAAHAQATAQVATAAQEARATITARVEDVVDSSTSTASTGAGG